MIDQNADKNRTKLDIMADIVEICASGENGGQKCNMGQIMLHTRISYTQFKKYLDDMLLHKLLEICGEGTYKNEKIYRATEKGINFMRDVRNVNTYITVTA
jgi:predicted transcriptional regulator